MPRTPLPKPGRERLAEVLKARGLTTRQAAVLAGVSHGAISLWERGHRHPSMASAARLKKAFGIPLSSWVVVTPAPAEAAA